MIGFVIDLPSKRRGNASRGLPSSDNALGSSTETCGSVPSPLTSQLNCFVFGSPPSRTIASNVAAYVVIS